VQNSSIVRFRSLPLVGPSAFLTSGVNTKTAPFRKGLHCVQPPFATSPPMGLIPSVIPNYAVTRGNAYLCEFNSQTSPTALFPMGRRNSSSGIYRDIGPITPTSGGQLIDGSYESKLLSVCWSVQFRLRWSEVINC
jgi:hypothetical protein